jgi:hypothetical protein
MKRYTTLALLSAVVLSSFAGLAGCSDSDAPTSTDALDKKKQKRDELTLSCSSSTDSTITIQVKAGSSGAANGFSIQWMKQSEYDSTRSWDSASEGGFSGSANNSKYKLGANGTVLVTLGMAQTANGADGDSMALECGTVYLFRAFAHGNNTGQRSDYSETIACTTAACDSNDTADSGDCTRGLGYWKHHMDKWMLDSLVIGGRTYTKAQLMSILTTPPRGSHLLIFARQLIIAQLNRARIGDTTSTVIDAIDSANALIGNLVVPPVGNGSLRPSTEMNRLMDILARYNDGEFTAGSCDEDDDDVNG